MNVFPIDLGSNVTGANIGGRVIGVVVVGTILARCVGIVFVCFHFFVVVPDIVVWVGSVVEVDVLVGARMVAVGIGIGLIGADIAVGVVFASVGWCENGMVCTR